MSGLMSLFQAGFLKQYILYSTILRKSKCATLKTVLEPKPLFNVLWKPQLSVL